MLVDDRKKYLRSKAKYFLTVKAESEGKTSLRRVEVLVDPLVEGSVSVALPATKVNPFYVNY